MTIPPSHSTHAPPDEPTRARRVLVTGGAGFVGAALARELVGRGAEVLCVDDLSAGRVERLTDHPALRFQLADVAREGALAAILAGEAPFDALVHLAARVGVRAVLRDPEGARRVNEDSARELARAVLDLDAERRPRVFAASSSEVYADAHRPLRESDPLRTSEARGRWAYAASKLAGERLLDAAFEREAPERRPVHLRFFNVVGPGQDSGGGMVLPTFVEHARASRPLPVHGDGSAVRTFAHVDEVARALARLVLDVDAPAGALNVGGSARASVMELAQCVLRNAGGAAGIRRVDPRAHAGAGFEEVAWREPDLARLAALGIEPPSMRLEAIVADVLARHPALAETPRDERAEAGRPVCASPAS